MRATNRLIPTAFAKLAALKAQLKAATNLLILAIPMQDEPRENSPPSASRQMAVYARIVRTRAEAATGQNQACACQWRAQPHRPTRSASTMC
jgi:hypothetical protein